MLREAALGQAQMQQLVANKIGDRPVRFESWRVRSGNRNNVFVFGHGSALELEPGNIIIIALGAGE